MVGTLAYLAPEQITKQVSTPASDIFTLGMIFYELLTGKLLYQGEKISSLIDKILYYAPEPLQAVNPALPSVLNDLVLAMQAKDPAQRPALAYIIKTLDSIAANSV
jgi:serine/threonine-protein kinase